MREGREKAEGAGPLPLPLPRLRASPRCLPLPRTSASPTGLRLPFHNNNTISTTFSRLVTHLFSFTNNLQTLYHSHRTSSTAKMPIPVEIINGKKTLTMLGMRSSSSRDFLPRCMPTANIFPSSCNTTEIFSIDEASRSTLESP